MVTKNRARMSADIVADLILLKESLLPAKAYGAEKVAFTSQGIRG